MQVVRLAVHMEPVPQERRIAWWADSEDVPGFSAVANSLPELRERATAALREVVATDVDIRYLLVSNREGPTLDVADPRAGREPLQVSQSQLDPELLLPA